MQKNLHILEEWDAQMPEGQRSESSDKLTHPRDFLTTHHTESAYVKNGDFIELFDAHRVIVIACFFEQ